MRWWIVGIGGICLAVGVILVTRYENSPKARLTSQEKMDVYKQILGREPQLTPVDTNIYDTYHGKYVTFVYPAWASLSVSASPSGLLLENVHFFDNIFHIDGQISVTKRPGLSDITGDPAVDMRKINPSYATRAMGSTAYTFSKNPPDGERSWFVLQDENVYSIVISGENSEKMDIIFNRIKDSIVIK